MKPRRIAVVGVSHWHSQHDAAYLEILRQLKLDIVGVSDSLPDIANDRAARYGSRPFTDYRMMIEQTRPDFIIGLGRHVEMPTIFRHLVETGVPFLMEKPWGVDTETVNQLADLAEKRRAWVAVPFVYRYQFWAQVVRRMVESGELGKVSHLVFRNIRPSMARYREWDSPWMLDKAIAGGGALINIGCHGFDLCRYLTGEEPVVVSATLSNAVHQLEVEDYALVTLRTPSGIVLHNEVGYTMPTWPANTVDREMKLASERLLLRAVPEGVQVLGHNRNEIIRQPAGYTEGFPRFVSECLERIENGEPPPIGARDCARVADLVHEAYRIAR